MFYEVVPEGKVEALTYTYTDSLLPGQIVLVPVGKRQVPGVVIKKVVQPEFKTKSILKVLYAKPLPKHLLKVILFLHEYYLAPSGQAVSLILPQGVEKKRRKTEQMFGSPLSTSEPASFTPSIKGDLLASTPEPAPVPTLKTERLVNFPQISLSVSQKKALEGLQQAPGATKLLFGVTGSGKTNIYLQLALNAFKQQKSTIVLVPEIALTSQFVRVFEEVFGENIILIHSKQTEVERHLIFNSLLDAKGPKIVIGPRSALFAPLNDIGLMIIDEEHENAYYQENPPRYSTVRVASFIAKTLEVPLVLGSATPTIEDFHLAIKHGTLTKLTTKVKAAAKKPEIKVVDFKNRDNFLKNRYFSDALLGAITENLAAKRQTLIFHNRRGSAPLTICESCGEEVLCPNCYLPLTLHADKYVLYCHTCGFYEKVPTACPKCHHPGMIHKGFGTKLLESELKKLFKKARIQRFDADNKKSEGLEAVYEEIKSGQIDILVGTQTLAKGLDLPKLATVGIVQADAGLSLPDYVAEERTFQLITQVIGRVGRGHLEKAEVIVQTFRPEHPILGFAIKEDYLGFYTYLISKRKDSGFPPFYFMAKIGITLKTEALALKKISELRKELMSDERVIVSPPQPAFHERTNRGYTWQILMRARSRKVLVDICKKLGPNFKITLDPPSLL